MRSDLVIVSTPVLQFLLGVIQRQEPMCVQALGPEPAIECLDERIVRRLARREQISMRIVTLVAVAAILWGCATPPVRSTVVSLSTTSIRQCPDVPGSIIV